MGAIALTAALAGLGAPASALANRAPFPRPAAPVAQRSPRPLDGRYSLWDGQTAALELPREVASALAPGAAPPAAAQPAPWKDSLFIGLQIDLRRSARQLKDALADLTSAGGFQPDRRFEPAWVGHGEALEVWGWVPAAKVDELSRLAPVRGVSIERWPQRPISRDPAMVTVLVGVRRVGGFSSPEADARFSQDMRELADTAGFRWLRTPGYQGIPNSDEVAVLVLGQAPAPQLGRLMAHPDVVKVQPFPGVQLGQSAAQRRPPPAARFLGYVAVQSPLLLVVTGILLLPPFRPRLTRWTRRRRGG